MKAAVKLFLDKDGEFIFGPGRAMLLKAVHDHGSLRKAAQHLGMSYRWAWGRLTAAEKELGIPLLVSSKGGSGGRPKVLTPQACALLQWYDDVEKKLEKSLEKSAANLHAILGVSSPVATPAAAAKKIRLD